MGAQRRVYTHAPLQVHLRQSPMSRHFSFFGRRPGVYLHSGTGALSAELFDSCIFGKRKQVSTETWPYLHTHIYISLADARAVPLAAAVLIVLLIVVVVAVLVVVVLLVLLVVAVVIVISLSSTTQLDGRG